MTHPDRRAQRVVKPSRPDRRPIYFAVAMGLFGLTLGIAFLLDWQLNVMRVERLDADLRTRLPLGCTWEEARGWFSANEIPFLVSDDGPMGRRMLATIRNNSFLECAEIYIELMFGPDGLLQSRFIRRQLYES